MSKKELLERMTATRAGSADSKAVRRPSEPAAPAPVSAGPSDPRTQRVSAQVVRRRAVDTPAPAPETPVVTTVRRRALDVSGASTQTPEPEVTRRGHEAKERP